MMPGNSLRKNLLKKYTVDSIDPDGWMVCNPKPENSVEFCEITSDVLDNAKWGPPGSGYIHGQWGETILDLGANLQHWKLGDFIVRNREDTTDVWVVARKIFINSYTELS